MIGKCTFALQVFLGLVWFLLQIFSRVSVPFTLVGSIIAAIGLLAIRKRRPRQSELGRIALSRPSGVVPLRRPP